LNYGTWNVEGIRGKMEEMTLKLGKLNVCNRTDGNKTKKGTGSEIVGGAMFICIAEYLRTDEQKGEFPF